MSKIATIVAVGLMVVLVGIPAIGETVVTFQEGVGGYAGTSDTKIDSNDPTGNYGASDFLRIRYSGRANMLIKFDNIFGSGAGQIPNGADIQSASLTLNCLGENVSSITFRAMLADWTDSSTWNSLGAPLDTSKYLDVPASSVSLTGAGLYTLDVTDTLIAFYRDYYGQSQQVGDVVAPMANKGWVGWTNYTSTAYADFDSSEIATIANRPLLSVSYVPEPATMSLLALGMGCVLAKKRRR